MTKSSSFFINIGEQFTSQKDIRSIGASMAAGCVLSPAVFGLCFPDSKGVAVCPPGSAWNRILVRFGFASAGELERIPGDGLIGPVADQSGSLALFAVKGYGSCIVFHPRRRRPA